MANQVAANPDDIKARASALIEALRREGELEDVKAVHTSLAELRGIRAYPLLLDLAEAVSRVAPREPTTRRFYAQGLIESGRVTAAQDVLEAVKASLPADHQEAVEAAGLLGRSYKQMYFDARVRGSEAARDAIARAITAYGDGYRANPARNTWHGVNLLALIAHCRRAGVDYPRDIKPKVLAQELLTTLHAFPEDERDDWYLATLAEVSLGTGDWDTIAKALQDYTLSPKTTAFHIQSTLRQFTEVWNIQQEPQGAVFIKILTAHLMQIPGAISTQASVPAEPALQNLPSEPQFQAVLGKEKGTQTHRWWTTGVDQGRGVAAIREKLGKRIGTGFLVRSRDVLKDEPGEFVVLTNFHVVNRNGEEDGAVPDAVEIVFEAVDPNIAYEIDEIVWESRRDECDVSVLRLTTPVTNPKPLDIAKALPVIEPAPPQQPVYVIGHFDGNELTYSFQSNDLIDHEGPNAGMPAIPGICRVHYAAATERGNSGSPVFNGLWKVIALHHKGGKTGMPKLNGKDGTYGANEGIWIQSIIAKLRP